MTTSFFTQIGSDIDGVAGYESNNLVSLSADGSTVAIGVQGDLGSGQVKIFKNVNDTWTQVGSDINGETNASSGWSVSLSADGSIVAIGNQSSIGVKIYKNINNTWTQLGSNINGNSSGDNFGESVSLSANGNIVAIGATQDYTGNGYVRIYQNVNDTWIKVGADINGESFGDQSGGYVSLSDNGNIVAIGAEWNDNNNGNDSGHVRIYKNVNNSWIQIGGDIDGADGFDLSGNSISLSSDGSVVAIGAWNKSSNGPYKGHVRIYKNVNNSWIQIGGDIDGEADRDHSGQSVSLSADGNLLAIGAKYNRDNGIESGHVRIYKNVNDTWTQVGSDIDGEAAYDRSGTAVSLSADGSTVAISAPDNDGNGIGYGHVRIYKINNVDPNNSDTTPPDAPSLTNYAIRTNDSTPTITGTAEAGSTVKLYNGSTLLGSATAESNGIFSITSTPLTNGNYSLTATSTDAAGNISSASIPLSVTIQRHVFNTRAGLDNAINAWITDEVAATSTYGDINTWDVSAITDFSFLFSKNRVGVIAAENFNSDISNWDLSSAKSIAEMFRGATSFNQDISGWDVSSVESFAKVFMNANSFNQEIGGWDVSNGTNFYESFAYAYKFNKDIGDWDVSNGDEFRLMFKGAISFDQDISSWDVSSGKNFQQMFVGATSFNQDIRSWDVSSGSDFGGMFAAAGSFDQDISGWNTNSATTYQNMFLGAIDMLANQGVDASPNGSYFSGETKTGDSTGETITGGIGNDVLSGLSGNDNISGGDGWDKILGGDGNDIINGGLKDDILTGGSGADIFIVSEGTDQINDFNINEGDKISFSNNLSYSISQSANDLLVTVNSLGNFLLKGISTTEFDPNQHILFNDKTPPNAPSSLSNSSPVNDPTPTITGYAEDGSTVKLFHGTTLLGSATANSNGTFSITSSTLTKGNYSLTATATDAAGNISPLSPALSITVNQNLITGEFEWAKLIGSSSGEEAYGISIDSESNILITGTTEGNLNGQINNGDDDVFIMKLDSNGNELWTKLFGSNFEDIGYSVKISKDGSIFLIGETQGNLNGEINNGDEDAFVMKLDSNGNEIWTKLFGTELSDIAWKGSVDENIYLWGETHGNLNGEVNSFLGNEDAFLIKLDSNGNEVWTTLIGTELHEEAWDIAVANDKSVYLVGETEDKSSPSNNNTDDILLAKIDQQGHLLWSKRFGENQKEDTAYSIDIGAEGNLYISGATESNLNGQLVNGSSGSFLMKLDKDGNEIWTKIYGTANRENAFDMGIRSDGYIYLTGMSDPNDKGFLKKIDLDGNEIWTKFFGSANWDFYRNLHLDDNGSSIYISGETRGGLANNVSNGETDAILYEFSDPFILSESLALNYIASNPDLIAAFVIDTSLAKSHYVNNGKSEGRSLTSFSATNYLAKYSDLSAAFGDDQTLALKHYIEYGFNEGRTDSSTQSESESGSGSISGGSSNLTDLEAYNYIASNNDLISAFGLDIEAAKSHYVNYGISEGRSLTSFSATNYLAKYSDLSAAFGSDQILALKHYIEYGFSEGRTDSSTDSGSSSSSGSSSNLSDFEALNYIASYGDLINAFGTDITSAKSHYTNNGKSEGRALDDFDEWGYLASNNDLINSFGSDTTEAVKHYISFGYSQGKVTNSFDAQSYLNNYADLRNAFGDNQSLATKHYVEYGFNEGRLF